MSTSYFISHLWSKSFWKLALSIWKLDPDDRTEYFLRSMIPASAFEEAGLALPDTDARFRIDRQDLTVWGKRASVERPLPAVLKPYIKTITLDGILTVPNGAFDHFRNARFVIANALTVLGEGSFAHEPLLTEVDFTLCEGLSEIPPKCFWEDISLTEICLPDSLEVIGQDAFGNCRKLETVYYTGNRLQWQSIRKESGNEALNDALVICLAHE